MVNVTIHDRYVSHIKTRDKITDITINRSKKRHSGKHRN